MSLPTVFETCAPREDVLSGTMAEADFAADLAKVIRGIASDDYQKPDRFFANTYPTAGLRNLLRNVMARLSGDSSAAAAIFRLDTSYGGGKTHGLIALTHAAGGMKGVANVSEFVDPKFVPTGKIRIAAFDGENADPANGQSSGTPSPLHSPSPIQRRCCRCYTSHSNRCCSASLNTAGWPEALADLKPS